MNTAAIQAMSKEELVNGFARMRAYIARAKDKLAAPLMQGTLTLSGWGGGIASGVVRTFIPEVFGVPVDGVAGVLISILALLGAGDGQIYDAMAVFGVGLAAPAFSRGTEGLLRSWMEKK